VGSGTCGPDPSDPCDPRFSLLASPPFLAGRGRLVRLSRRWFAPALPPPAPLLPVDWPAS